jgi:alpha-amylase
MRFLICLIFPFLLPSLHAQTVSITFEVDVSWEVAQNRFNPALRTVDIAGSFNGWGSTGHSLADPDGDLVYSVTIPGFTPGASIAFKFRQNASWDGTEEFPGGGPNRTLTVPAVSTTLRYWYSDRTPTSIPLRAAFGTSASRIRPGDAVRFTDASSGAPQTWSWHFEGGTPATATERDPVVSYAQSGVFGVVLAIVGAGGRTDTVRLAQAVRVDAAHGAPGVGPVDRPFYRWSTTRPSYNGPWGQPVWHSRNGNYFYGLFWSGMPDVNHDHAPARDSIFEAARYWLEDVGVDGFRLDAVLYLDEDGSTLSNTPGTFQILQDFKTATSAANPMSFLVGEAWTQSSIVRNYVSDGRLDYAFEFDLSYRIIDALKQGNAAPVANHLNTIRGLYGPGKWGTFLTNHDQDRIGNVLSFHPGRLRAAARLLLGLPGVPYLYFAEEIGASGEKSDPNIRRPIDWEDVATQRADSTSLWHTYQRHIAIRHTDGFYRHPQHVAYANGALLTQVFHDADRRNSGLVIHNLGGDTLRVEGVGTAALLEMNALFNGANLSVERVTGDSLRNPTTNHIAGVRIPPYQVRIWAVDHMTGTGIDDRRGAGPDGIELVGNWPNPFNPSTVIRWTLDAGRQTRLSVYDVLGREIAVLVNEVMPAGTHSVTFDAGGLSSGVYLVRLEADGLIRTQRMTLLK